MNNPTFWQKMYVLSEAEGGYGEGAYVLFNFSAFLIICAIAIIVGFYIHHIKVTVQIGRESPIISLKELKKYYWLSPDKYWLRPHCVSYGHIHKNYCGDCVSDYKLGINWYEYIRYSLFVKKLENIKNKKANYELTMKCRKKYAAYLECVQEDINKIREESAKEMEESVNILSGIKIK